MKSKIKFKGYRFDLPNLKGTDKQTIEHTIVNIFLPSVLTFAWGAQTSHF